MYSYRVKPLFNSDKLIIEFSSTVDDADFRTALSVLFEPLGYHSEYDGNYYSISSDLTVLTERGIRIESDQWGSVWCEAYPWADTARNHKWIHFADNLLQQSGLFIKEPTSD